MRILRLPGLRDEGKDPAHAASTIPFPTRGAGYWSEISQGRPPRHALVGLDERGITFRYKDHRSNGRKRFRTMTLAPGEFIRRFLLYILPKESIASATTDCSPAPPARPTSRAPQN